MESLELVRSGDVMSAVMLKVLDAGFDIVQSDGYSVSVKAGCLSVAISWEMCSCHGGRMWLNQNETNIHIELSSDEYDNEKGIEDPETELAYYIDNEMVDTIKGFEKYIYVVTTIGKYTEGKKEVRYFNSVEAASCHIFEEPGHDVMSEYGSVLHQYPNKDIQARYTFDHEKDGRIYFKAERLQRERGTNNPHKLTNEYEIEFRVYRKGQR